MEIPTGYEPALILRAASVSLDQVTEMTTIFLSNIIVIDSWAQTKSHVFLRPMACLCKLISNLPGWQRANGTRSQKDLPVVLEALMKQKHTQSKITRNRVWFKNTCCLSFCQFRSRIQQSQYVCGTVCFNVQLSWSLFHFIEICSISIMFAAKQPFIPMKQP